MKQCNWDCKSVFCILKLFTKPCFLVEISPQTSANLSLKMYKQSTEAFNGTYFLDNLSQATVPTSLYHAASLSKETTKTFFTLVMSAKKLAKSSLQELQQLPYSFKIDRYMLFNVFHFFDDKRLQNLKIQFCFSINKISFAIVMVFIGTSHVLQFRPLYGIDT